MHPALPQGTRIGEIHVNPFHGAIEIRRFYLCQAGVPWMRVDSLRVDVHTLGLLTGAAKIERIALDDAYLRVERLAEGGFDLGIPGTGDAAGPEDRPPADVTLNEVTITDLKIDYRDGDLNSAIAVDRLQVGKYSLSADRQQMPIELDLSWDGEPIAGEFDIRLATGRVGAAGELTTGALDLVRAQRLARIEPQAIGDVSIDGRLEWDGERARPDGALAASRLAHRIGGRDVLVDGLQAPAFNLVLALSPMLEVDFVTERPMTAL